MAAPHQPDDSEIYERVWTSIAERKLAPGTRLKEERLCEIFSVSRARVRRVLDMLAHDGLVTHVPNRGAFVSKPTIEEARDLFFARRVVEDGLIERLAQIATPGMLARLEAHVAEERAAHAARDMGRIVRLSGAFHILIAELSGSAVLTEALRDLVSRSSLVTAMYQPRTTAECGPDEHAGIVRLIAEGRAAEARAAMRAHLSEIEEALDLRDDGQDRRSVDEILAEALG